MAWNVKSSSRPLIRRGDPERAGGNFTVAVCHLEVGRTDASADFVGDFRDIPCDASRGGVSRAELTAASVNGRRPAGSRGLGTPRTIGSVDGSEDAQNGLLDRDVLPDA